MQKKTNIKIDKLILGSNYTYIFDTEIYSNIEYGKYIENTIAFNAAVDFAKYFRFGIDFKKIKTKGDISGINKYKLIGFFSQYKFGETKKGFGFGELGFYIGNYCTCGKDVPYKKNNLSYLNWGGGYNLKLQKYLRLDFAFTTAQVISKVVEPYGYTQYIIGLDYLIPLTKY